MKNLFFYFALLLLVASCSDDEKNVSKIIVDSGFSSYVNAFTSGIISSESDIKIILLEPQANIKEGDAVNTDLFSFDPEIKGKAYWADSQTIIFNPDNRLKSGEKYEVEFNLGGIMKVPSDYSTIKFDFVTLRQSIFVSYDGVQTVSDDFSTQTLYGKLRTSDIADAANIEQCLKATQEGKELTIKWEHDAQLKTHKYFISDVKRMENESEVILSWSGDAIGADIDDELEVRIPPAGEFSLMKIQAVQSPGMYFSLLFSDPVAPNQDLNGLISLKSGKKLRFAVSDNEIKAYPLSKLYSKEIVIVNQSIKNTKGNSLVTNYEKSVKFNLAKPAVKLIGNGVIMPSNGAINFPFKAINLKAINLRILQIYEHNVSQFFQVNQFSGSSQLSRVGRIVYDDVVDLVTGEPIDFGEWNNFSVDLNKLITPEPGAIYRVMIAFEQYQSLYPCADTTDYIKPLKRRKHNFDENSYFDDDSWYEGYYDYSEKDNPCSPSYYKYYNRSVSANVFVSNFGIISKEAGGNNFSVTITDLRTTKPVSGVKVEAYNFQNIKIGDGRTNKDGVAVFETSGTPYMMIAKKGKKRGYLRVDKGSALSVSLYDVGGVDVQRGIKGFIYGERGVWRPGDTLFLSFMLEDKLGVIPETHPVIMELYDPMGKLYDKKVSSNGVEGLYSFKFKTDTKSPTGKWTINAKVGNSTFSKLLKIETIKPNRLRVEYDFDDVITSKQISTNANVQWLYGAPGADLKVRSEMSISKLNTSFKGYEGFSFNDHTVYFDYQLPVITEATTNASGDVKLSFNKQMPSAAPGMLKLMFNTKIFEKGGDFSQDFISKKYSPYDAYVGVKLEKGKNWIKALDTEKKHKVAIALLDEQGKALSGDVTVELYKKERNWWYEGSGSDVMGYVSRHSYSKLKTDQFTVENGKSFYELSFINPGWGKYMVRVVYSNSEHSCSQTFFGRYSSWYNDDAEGSGDAASAINIETGKADYKVGENVEVTLPSGGVGNVFVTIEKGDQILDRMWVEAGNKSTTFSFKATKEMTPNVYVNAMLIQPHAQEENSLPIRMYGVVPVNVYDEETILEPQIKCADVLQPESSYEVTVSEKTGKKMSYTLAVVDEGLLSLTRYITPNPWKVFYAKEALKTRTWDMYKYVMSAVTGKMAAVLAVGGDEGLNFKDQAEANRFEPVVSYIGPFLLGKGDENTHQLNIPNYIGAVRIMVVGGYEGAYGSAEKEVQVKQALMVLSTLPRVLGPSEQVKVPINIISMDDKIKKVNVKVESNDLLKFTGPTQKTVQFDKEGEKTVYFDCKVARKLGIAKFKVEVSSGKEKAFEDIELSVRAPNPEITESESKALNKGEMWNKEYKAIGITGSNKAVLQLSSVPDLDIEKHLKYLIGYPHGCIEQTTSKAFPQLYLSSLIKLSDEDKDRVQKHIISALNKLRDFQQTNGGFGYWPGSSYASEWGTNYAGHFMVEAKNKGYDLPPGVFDNWVKHQKNQVTKWNRSDYYHYGRYGGDLMQAYRLYTLALAGEGDMGAMNRLRNDDKLSNAGAWRLAAAYAIMGQEQAARELMQTDYHFEYYRSTGYSYGSSLRDLAMVLETLHYSESESIDALAVMKDIAKQLKYGWHSTQTRAFCMIAIAKYIGDDDMGNSNLKAQVNVNGKNIMVESEMPVYNIEILEENLKSGNFNVENKTEKMIFASFIQSGVPVEVNTPAKEEALHVEVSYYDLQNNPLDVSSLKRGQDFKAKVKVKHPGTRNPYNEMALNQIFPSGWQIVNTRVSDDANNSGIQNYTYRDIRDDRVYTYFNLNRAEQKTFEVLLNATFAGKYYMPAIFCAPMYDESIFSIKPGKWVEVRIE